MTTTPGPSAYLVPARTADVEVEARRSRFRCRLERVADEAMAREVVEAARKRHWDAGHHCSAFVLGPDAGTARSSDDGEPAGSAGAPMLETLRGREVSDVVAVVSRWFGGTLLGVGGLVRAYSEAVALALDEAGVLRRERREVVVVDAGHAEAGRLEHELRARRTARAGGDAARHPGRAHRGSGLAAPRRDGLGRPAAGLTPSTATGGQPACSLPGGSTEVWLGSSFCGTRPTGQVIPLGPWLQ